MVSRFLYPTSSSTPAAAGALLFSTQIRAAVISAIL